MSPGESIFRSTIDIETGEFALADTTLAANLRQDPS
jgi:hypothetical protein